MRGVLLLLPLIGPFFSSAAAEPPTGAAPDTQAVISYDAPAEPGGLARMIAGRMEFAAVKLADGRVLAAGGRVKSGAALASAEIYDPKTGGWSPAAPMAHARYSQLALLLRDGRVLVAGGRTSARGDSMDSVEIYDPRADAWRDAAPMLEARDEFGWAQLRDGRVLVAGGYRAAGGQGVTAGEAEIYDPSADVWTSAGRMSFTRGDPGVTAMPDGRVLVAGGNAAPGGNVAGRALTEAEIYDPRTGRWTPTGSMARPRNCGSLAVLRGGRVIAPDGNIAGSEDEGSEFYDPRSGAWSPGPPLNNPRAGAAAVRAAGRIAVVGGQDRDSTLDSAEVFDEGSRRWKYMRLLRPRAVPAAVALDGRRVLVIAGGSDAENTEDDTSEILDLDGPEAQRRSPRAPVVQNPPALRTYAQRLPLALPAPEPLYAPRGPERPDDYALVVGVGGYKTLPPADFAENDAREMAQAFGALGVPEENVVVLTGDRASLSEVSKYVEEWLPRRVTKDSRVYFYFSGHGAPDVKDGSAYLMPWDADSSFVKSTGFSLTRLYEALGALPVGQVVAVIDACFSGAGGRSVVGAGLRPLVTVRLPAKLPPRISVLAASESEEIAGSLPERAHGLFSYYVLRGLSGAADVRKKGHVTLQDLHAYVRKHVILDARRQNREQTPTLTSPNPKLRLY